MHCMSLVAVHDAVRDLRLGACVSAPLKMIHKSSHNTL
jgi:hypothetical protein